MQNYHISKSYKKKCIRNLAGASYNTHCDPIFHELGILKFDDLFCTQGQSFMYRYQNGAMPNSFDEMFTPLSNQNRTLSFMQPLIITKKLEKFPSYFLPKLWNSLPHNSKTVSTHRRFQKDIKTKALKSYGEFRCSRRKCLSCII